MATPRLNRVHEALAKCVLGLCAASTFLPIGCNELLDLGLQGPTVTAPADRVVECDGAGNEAALNAWLDSATITQGCGGATLTYDFSELTPRCGAAGTVMVTWIVTDQCGLTGRDSARFTIMDTAAPTLNVPRPISVACGDAASIRSLQEWVDSATAADTCGAVTITTERLAVPGDCKATINWTATDSCGNEARGSSTYTTLDDITPPTLTLLGDANTTIECGDTSWIDPGVAVDDDCDSLIEPVVTGRVEPHTPGMYELLYSAVDACGNVALTTVRMVTVVDTRPPVVTLTDAISLWPPNHQVQTLTLADLMTVTDMCEGMLDPDRFGLILDIYSDEPDNDTGDGNTGDDIVIADDHTFSLRVERSGGGNGRVYGIRFEVSDTSGNTVEGLAVVHVPHDQSGRTAVDDGAAAGHLVAR